MDDMTMGQRIAVRRKLKNMSQEALAEQLEVSRQAISKWESDGAIPEIDKLIALGKLFGVSVGWLLGTEPEEGVPLPGNCLTESQITAVEEIVARSLPVPLPKRRRWPGTLLTAAVLVLVLAVGAACAGRLEAKNAENLAAVESLRRENEVLRGQMDSVQEKLKAIAEADRLLKSMYGEAVLLDQTARVSFTFTPKVYQEEAQAFLSVRMPPQNAELIPCTWNGEKYTAEVELPTMDGYQYSFLLVTEGMFREQSLMDPDFFYAIDRLSNIGTSCHFHLDPDSEQFALMYNGLNHRWLDPELEEYTFRENLYSPCIFRKNGQGYQEILLILEMNGEVLLKESLLEDFLRHSGGHPVSTKPFPLEVSVPLPELKYGDKLRLYLSVTMADGMPSYTYLDEMFSWERPE